LANASKPHRSNADIPAFHGRKDAKIRGGETRSPTNTSCSEKGDTIPTCGAKKARAAKSDGQKSKRRCQKLHEASLTESRECDERGARARVSDAQCCDTGGIAWDRDAATKHVREESVGHAIPRSQLAHSTRPGHMQEPSIPPAQMRKSILRISPSSKGCAWDRADGLSPRSVRFSDQDKHGLGEKTPRAAAGTKDRSSGTITPDTRAARTLAGACSLPHEDEILANVHQADSTREKRQYALDDEVTLNGNLIVTTPASSRRQSRAPSVSALDATLPVHAGETRLGSNATGREFFSDTSASLVELAGLLRDAATSTRRHNRQRLVSNSQAEPSRASRGAKTSGAKHSECATESTGEQPGNPSALRGGTTPQVKRKRKLYAIQPFIPG
jgi:hypothetical protein